MDKNQLPKDFGLFRTFFAVDYIEGSEGVCRICHLKMEKIQLPKDFGLFRTFFA